MVRLEELGQLKIIHLIRGRTRDLPAYSLVPQPTTLPRAPILLRFHIFLSVGDAQVHMRLTQLSLRSTLCTQCHHFLVFSLYPCFVLLNHQFRRRCNAHLWSASWSNYTQKTTWCINISPKKVQYGIISSSHFLLLNSSLFFSLSEMLFHLTPLTVINIAGPSKSHHLPFSLSQAGSC
jgi:hypothetical protein